MIIKIVANTKFDNTEKALVIRPSINFERKQT